MKYPTLDAWLLAILNRLNAERDNWFIFTGEEGDGKSTNTRKVLRRLDYLMRNWQTAEVQLVKDGPMVPLRNHWKPNFPAPRPFALGHGVQANEPADSIRFGQDSLLDLLSELEVGGIAVGDEIEGSKRLAMYADRQELLDHVKEGRALRHNVALCFPQFTDFEAIMTKKRFAWWVHSPKRGKMVVRERKSSGDNFDAHGEVYVATKWPKVGTYPIREGNDPWKPRYEVKKMSRMRDRNARRRDEGQGPTASTPTSNRIPPGIIDMVLGELKKP